MTMQIPTGQAEAEASFNTADRNKIAAKLGALPYSGMAPNTRLVVDVDTLIDWLEALRGELIAASARNEADRRELDELKGQRDAIRSFLGTAEILKEL